MIVKTNGHLMHVKSIAECSLEAFCNTFDLHYAIIGLEKTNNFLSFFLSGLVRHVLMYTGIQFEKLKKLIVQPTHTGKTGSGKGKQKYF